MNHSEWLDTIDSEPDVISMHLLPLTSLLSDIRGYGFLAHAINLYLLCKYYNYLICFVAQIFGRKINMCAFVL
jgi:hypothetical protein